MLDMLALLLMLSPQVLLVWYLTQMELLLQQIPHLLLLPELNTWLPEMLLMLLLPQLLPLLLPQLMLLVSDMDYLP